MSTFLKLAGIFFLTILVFFTILYFSFIHLSSLQHTNPRRTALMTERGGGVSQIWVPLTAISPELRTAVITAEDGRFYEHRGIDFYELREAIKKDIDKRGFARGSSTISMQLVKNLYLSKSKTIGRKILEILITLRMEQELSKNRILELYLNVIEWGPGIYGAEAASRYYFKKSAVGLSLDEAAFLAAIIPNPTRWGHWPPGPYIARRKNIILARMGVKSLEALPPLPEEPEVLDPRDPEALKAL